MSTEGTSQPKRRTSPIVLWLIILVGGLGFLVIFGGIMLALLLPAVQAAREAARRNACGNNLRQIGLALMSYEQVHGTLPPAYIADESGTPMHSWRVLILPFLEQQSLYSRYDFKEPWNGPSNSKLHSEIVEAYHCASDVRPPTEMTTDYVAVVGPETAWPGASGLTTQRISQGDGTSNTIMVVEVSGAGIHWMEPRDMAFNDALQAVNVAPAPGLGPGISSHHPGGANAAYADGHVNFLDDATTPEQLRSMLTVNGRD